MSIILTTRQVIFKNDSISMNVNGDYINWQELLLRNTKVGRLL